MPDGKTKVEAKTHSVAWGKKMKVVEKKNDLCEKLFEFAVGVIEFLKTLPYSPENKTIKTQLSKSACSSGASYSPCQIASNC